MDKHWKNSIIINHSYRNVFTKEIIKILTIVTAKSEHINCIFLILSIVRFVQNIIHTRCTHLFTLTASSVHDESASLVRLKFAKLSCKL